MNLEVKGPMQWLRIALLVVLALTMAVNHWLYLHGKRMKRERLVAEFRAQLYAGRAPGQQGSGIAIPDRSSENFSWQRRELVDYEAALQEWRRARFRALLYGGATVPESSFPPNSSSNYIRTSWPPAERKAFLAALGQTQRAELLAAARSSRTSSSVAVVQSQNNVAGCSFSAGPARGLDLASDSTPRAESSRRSGTTLELIHSPTEALHENEKLWERPSTSVQWEHHDMFSRTEIVEEEPECSHHRNSLHRAHGTSQISAWTHGSGKLHVRKHEL